MRSTFEGMNLLLDEQILSFKSLLYSYRKGKLFSLRVPYFFSYKMEIDDILSEFILFSPLLVLRAINGIHGMFPLHCYSVDCIISGPLQLHGPSMFAVRAKIYEVLYNQASSIAFDETSSYWSALKCS